MKEIRIVFFRINRRRIPWAVTRMALDRRVMKKARLDFWKLLGTGTGESFTVKDADPFRWGALMVGDAFPTLAHWKSRSDAVKEFRLSPISVHGSWSRKSPFNQVLSPSEASEMKSWNGRVAAITRARIKWHDNLKFWRAVPPVNESLHSSPGLIKAIGIGEAPIGLQGTFSLWESPTAIRDFAYRSPAHQRAIAQTKEIGWYSEELFARFAVLEESGDW
ncbi:MAG: spheroidene monooxygenase [Actinobacteria bacterium]|nr:spheroidene monooxygenase [Actinomycetota bacterium]